MCALRQHQTNQILADAFNMMEAAHQQMAQSLEQIVSQEVAPAEPIPDPWEDSLLKQQQYFYQRPDDFS